MKRNLLRLLAVTAIVWLAGEIIYTRENPEKKYTGVILDETTDKLLKKSCFDCHSNETVYPWYSRLPGFSIVMGHHVVKGRDHLNFSNWDVIKEKNPEKIVKLWKEIVEEIDEGEMPVASYLMLHSDAKVSKADLDAIRQSLVDNKIDITKKGKHDDDDDDHHDD